MALHLDLGGRAAAALAAVAPTLRPYRRSWLGKDVLAGLVLTALLVPQGMAYAELAGLPPVTGLYTSVLCLLGYALLGPSKVLVLGPDSSLGPMIAATILPLMGADGDPARAVLLASALAILVGLLMLGAAAGRLGFVAQLLSKPTVIGYMNGLALTILVGQIPKLLGFSVDADTFLGECVAVVQGIAGGEVVAASAAIGLLSLGLILVLARTVPKLPAVLVAVVAAILLSLLLDLEGRGVSVVGALPQGLPSFTLPIVGLSDLGLLLAGAVGISLVALADTISTATSFAERRGETVDGNREMLGIGAANIAAGLFQGFPVSTSGSRTAVAEQSGARTQLAGVTGALAIAVMLVAFPALLADLPNPTLAALVIAASLSLVDVRGMLRLRRQRPADFLVSVIAFLGVALLGVLPGILIAILISIGDVFRRIWMPHRTVLGTTEGLAGLHDVETHPAAAVLPRCPVYRFDAPLIFANAATFRDDVRRLADADPRPHWIVVAAESISDVDTTAGDMLDHLVDALDRDGTRLVLAEMKGPVVAKLRSFGLEHLADDDRFPPTLDGALAAYGASHPAGAGPASSRGGDAP
jgi:high affinity sulfate transporter 1